MLTDDCGSKKKLKPNVSPKQKPNSSFYPFRAPLCETRDDAQLMLNSTCTTSLTPFPCLSATRIQKITVLLSITAICTINNHFS